MRRPSRGKPSRINNGPGSLLSAFSRERWQPDGCNELRSTSWNGELVQNQPNQNARDPSRPSVSTETGAASESDFKAASQTHDFLGSSHAPGVTCSTFAGMSARTLPMAQANPPSVRLWKKALSQTSWTWPNEV